MATLRIVVADDHEVVRKGLIALIEGQAGWEVCGEARSGREAVVLTRTHKPQVVVMDLSMPELNGLEAARQISKELPATEIVILTMHDTESAIKELLEAGVRGYVLKSDASRELVRAIQAVSQHKLHFTTAVSERLVQGFLGRAPEGVERLATRGQLTPREREIVQLLAEGKSNKEAAEILSLSVKTIETHRANIMRKLNIHTVTDLVRYAIRNGIVSA